MNNQYIVITNQIISYLGHFLTCLNSHVHQFSRNVKLIKLLLTKTFKKYSGNTGNTHEHAAVFSMTTLYTYIHRLITVNSEYLPMCP